MPGKLDSHVKKKKKKNLDTDPMPFVEIQNASQILRKMQSYRIPRR